MKGNSNFFGFTIFSHFVTFWNSQSYREYHSDIYPETNGLEAACGPSSWFKGNNQKVPRINLDPKKRPKEKLTVFQGPLADRDPEWTSAASATVSVSIEAEKENGHQNGSNGTNATTNNKVLSFKRFLTSFFGLYTLFEKSFFCPKTQFWQNPNIFTSFSPKIVFANFSREIKVVNS